MKRKLPPMTPDQVENLGRLSHAEIQAIGADYIKSQFEQAGERMRSTDAPRAAGGRNAPPLSNTGGKSGKPVSTVRLVLEDGVVKEIPQRRGWGGDSAFIDWINLTIGEETIVKITSEEGSHVAVSDDELMLHMSVTLTDIFGFGITSKRDKGANFYRYSWVIGDGWGMVCYGGQRNTIMVTLNGSGCAAAKYGWEHRLMRFLENSQRSRLTRVDLAHDDYTGTTYSVDKADKDHTDGEFNCGGRNPDCEYRGNWKNPNGKGRTFNVGNRTNGKFCRVYEKGRQLGDKNSEWVRIEVEFKSTDRVIPFDCLIRPGEYLAASYPAFNWINEHQERIYTTQKVVQASVERAVKWIKHQCGASIGQMVDLFGVDEFLKKVVREGVPAWSKVPVFHASPESIHQAKKSIFPVNLQEASVLWV